MKSRHRVVLFTRTLCSIVMLEMSDSDVSDTVPDAEARCTQTTSQRQMLPWGLSNSCPVDLCSAVLSLRLDVTLCFIKPCFKSAFNCSEFSLFVKIQGIFKSRSCNSEDVTTQITDSRVFVLQIEKELKAICNDILDVLDKHLILGAKNGESKVFYYKMYVFDKMFVESFML